MRYYRDGYIMAMRAVNLTGDWHIKDEGDKIRINKTLPKTTPLILMGDLIDCGLNRGMQWNQDNLTDQVTYLQEVLKPRRVLGYVLGNHEARVVRETGLNPYKSFLGEPTTNYYFKNAKAMGAVREVVIEHGTKSVQNPLTQLKTFGAIHPAAQVVALGHDHTLGFFRDGSQWLVRTGSLQTYPEYARKMLLPPKPMGYIRYDPKNDVPEVILVEG